jgi:hydrogenase-4 component B
MIGALAVACFVKVYGAVFLGTARSESGETARESPLAMTGPMAALAGCCIFIGVVPFVVAPVFNAAAHTYSPELGNGPELSTLAPLQRISQMALLLLGGLLVVGAALWLRIRRGVVLKASTWGCGYVAPTPRMQYTASSFAQMLVGLFGWALRPRSRTPMKLPLFPAKGSFHSEVPDTVLDDAVLPAFRFGASLFARFRVFQQGSVQGYLLYIFLALIVLLLWR